MRSRLLDSFEDRYDDIEKVPNIEERLRRYKELAADTKKYRGVAEIEDIYYCSLYWANRIEAYLYN